MCCHHPVDTPLTLGCNALSHVSIQAQLAFGPKDQFRLLFQLLIQISSVYQQLKTMHVEVSNAILYVWIRRQLHLQCKLGCVYPMACVSN